MKTRGLQVLDGALVASEFGFAVPRQFWHRLKAELMRRHLLEEFQAEYRRERAEVQARWADSTSYPSRHEDWQREERLFRRWVERCFGPQQIWPWERGWTEELVDSYLEPTATEQGRAA